MNGFVETVGASVVDQVALWLINGLALLKTYGLFSFMFGVGIGFLIASAELRNLPFGRLYRNRMIGRQLLGAKHGCLFFPGDILVIYSVTGSVVYFLRCWTVKRLFGIGTALLVFQLVIGVPLMLDPTEVPLESRLFEKAALAKGGFLDAVNFRAIAFVFTLPIFLIFLGLSALGWRCLG